MWDAAFKVRLLLAALGPFMISSSGYPVGTANTEQCQVVNGSSSNISSWNLQLPGPLLTLPPDSVSTGLESFTRQPEQSDATRQALDARLKVVLVLDPPFWGDYEVVAMTHVVRATLLPWVAALRDPLTATADQPNGQPLGTHFQNEWAGRPCSTYAEHVAAALEEAPESGGLIKLPKMMLVAFQLTTVGAAIKANGTVLEYSLPANNVQLTTVGKFWAAVESTNSFNSDAPAAPPRVVGVVDGGGGSTFFDDIAGLAGSVMILPRWVPWVTNEGWPSVTGLWDPPSKWTPDFVLQQARHFINAAKVF